MSKKILESVKNKVCIKCGKFIKPVNQDDRSKPEHAMWDGGIVDKIAAGYGSCHDGDMYIIGLCDECVTKWQDRLQYAGNYMNVEDLNLSNKITTHHSIVIGNNLETDKNYHLLIDKDGVKIDKIMSKDEYNLVMNIINVMKTVK